jgi:hypothetical protein
MKKTTIRRQHKRWPSLIKQSRESRGAPDIAQRIARLLPIAFLAIPLQTARSQTIEGVTIEDVSSELVGGFDRQAAYLLDGNEFDEDLGSHTLVPDGFMWLNNGTFTDPNDPNVPGAIITFDLEANYDLGSLTVWNYNEALPDNLGLLLRGANEVEILVAGSEGGPFTSLGDFVFTVAPGLDTEDFGQTIDLNAIPEAANARLVRFNITSNHGGDNNFVGLSEVRFTGASSPVLLSPAIISTAAIQGTTVGDLSTPRGDEGDTFSYELIAGDGDADTGKFQIAGDELQAGHFDFSTSADGAEFSLRVKSTGSPSGEEFEGALFVTATADSDADDLPDPWEERWAGVGNLSVLSGLDDANADDDSLTDLEEYDLRIQFPDLNPTERDSDDDTLDDGAEIAGAGSRPPTDPTNPDTDNDSLTDGVETNTGIDNGPEDTGSDPTLVDTDEDSFSDAIEVAGGSDPNDPASTPAVQLVGLWRFEGTAEDSSAYENHGTFENEASLSDDTPTALGGGQSLDLAGGTQHVLVPHAASLDMSAGITITAWVKRSESGWGAILAKSPSDISAVNYPGNYELRLGNGNGVMNLLWEDGVAANTFTNIADAGGAVAADTWTHIAFSGTNSGTYSFYINGVATGSGAAPANFLNDQNGSPLYLGSRGDLFTTLTGGLDDVALFSGELPASQIIDIMGGNFSNFGIGSSELKITAISVDGPPVNPSVTLTFNSRPGRNYKVEASADLKDAGTPGGWIELDDSYPSQGETTTYVDTQFAGSAPRVFYRVSQN